MLEFATTKLGRRFLADVTRIGGALERLADREELPEDEGPSVPLVAEVVNDTLPAALLRELGLLTRVVGVTVAGRRVMVTLDSVSVETSPVPEEDR